MHPIKNVFRCIIRHVYWINDAELKSELPALKQKLRKSLNSQVKQRQRIADLFMLEKCLRDICLGRSSISRFWSLYGENGLRERNQNGSFELYMQHEMRRFDTYNQAPAPGSKEAKIVHRRAAFANTFWNFAHKYNNVPGVSPNAMEVADPHARKWSVIIGTILAPFRDKQIVNSHLSKSNASKNSASHDFGPRKVRIKTVERNSLTLSVLQVSGRRLPNHGFRMHLAAINKDLHGLQQQLDDQIWLASEYSKDPLDGEDMSDWIEILRAEQSKLKNEAFQLKQKLEVQRRILMRRRDEMQRYYDWKYRQYKQNCERKAILSPPKLLTLKDL